jgi:hypothetical protein
MSQHNVEFVRRSLKRFLATGQPDFDTLDEGVEIHDYDIPEQGEYRGHQGFLRWLEDWARRGQSGRFTPRSSSTRAIASSPWSS